eukprot:GEMP01010376.1.p1 GENE.GEMP01010376.1~~GEMP01010376.1.p1  ORF type:complete len:428 (+),score=64.22 GEMP01010376.1:351-1634(+)
MVAKRPNDQADSPAKKARLVYKSGQNLTASGLCLATFLNGTPCCSPAFNAYVPYCKKHMDNGDPSIKVVKHPKFGKMLVAVRDLPGKYYMALYGNRKNKKDVSDANMNWAFETASSGFIDPDGYESQVKYCQCPGPHEVVTVTFAAKSELVSMKSPTGSMIFITNRPVPKNYQLVMMYNDSEKSTNEFFADRNIKRCDVGTPEYPCMRKKIRGVPNRRSPTDGLTLVHPRYKSGQHTVKSGACIATFLDGKPCCELACENYVPYCREHMKKGDPSMKVVKHPKYGKCLVAARELPARYYMALFGNLMPKKVVAGEQLNWCFITEDGQGTINPATQSSQIKYCQCPGPNEIVTVAFAAEPMYCRKGNKLGSMLFTTTRTLPKTYQLVMMYSEDERTADLFFEERGIVRADVGTTVYPCFRKKRAQSTM